MSTSMEKFCTRLGALTSGDEGTSGRSEKVTLRTRLMMFLGLLLGLFSSALLTLSVTTDHWLMTAEGVKTPEEWMLMNSSDYQTPEWMLIRVHSGLWRFCYSMAMEGFPVSTSVSCELIDYNQPWGVRFDGGETTFAIFRAIRKSLPVFVSGLILMLIGLALCIYGNAKQNVKTLIGAVCYILSSLFLALGVILYISGVNDEVHHRMKTKIHHAVPPFVHDYQWSLALAGIAFISSMFTAVINITIFLKRYTLPQDMMHIIPGLEKDTKFTSIPTHAETLNEDIVIYDTPPVARSATLIL